jgi:surface antigen
LEGELAGTGQMPRASLLVKLPLLLALCAIAYAAGTRINFDRSRAVGEVVDEFNGVKVYYNGGVNHSSGRILAPDGYNVGIRYQCVEFVKRYYYERFNHEMPESRGNAKDFFDADAPDGSLNASRGLIQFRNGSPTPPQADDILVFGPALFNPYGHVAIVSAATGQSIEIVQQNAGPFAGTRDVLVLVHGSGGWTVDSSRVRGWLRMPPPARHDVVGRSFRNPGRMQ